MSNIFGKERQRERSVCAAWLKLLFHPGNSNINRVQRGGGGISQGPGIGYLGINELSVGLLIPSY